MATPKPSEFTRFDIMPRSLVGVLPDAVLMGRNLRAAADCLALIEAYLESQRDDPLRLARAFVMLRALKDDMDLLEKRWNRLFEFYKTQVVPRVLEEAGMPSVPLSEGYRVGTSFKYWASILNKHGAYAWLRVHNLEELIVEQVNPQTLSATARHMFQEEGKELPPDLFSVEIVANTSVTKT